MPRNPTRPALLALTLLTLLLAPTLANALPLTGTLRAADDAAAPGLFSKLWDLLSAVWTTGSILEPDGAIAGTAPGTGPNAAATGDTGSILDPDG